MRVLTSCAQMKSTLTVLTLIFNCVSCQRPRAVDTWILSNRDRYVLSYTVTRRQEPHVSWWWKSSSQHSEYEQLQHTPTDNFHETITTVERDEGTLYDIRLEISNINKNIFGEYKVEIDGNSNMTRYFTINEMPSEQLDGLNEIPAASDEADRFEFSKNQVYIAVGVAVGILIAVALISITIIVRVKTKRAGRSESQRNTTTENNSEGLSISSHHYTDVHSTTGYEGLSDKRDQHEYITTLNTTANHGGYNDPATIHKPATSAKKKTFANTLYGESNLVIKSGIKPSSLLKPVPKVAYKKKQNKDREDTCTYENVAKYSPGAHSYENCNNLKRTKSAQ
ncbi:uncharacterized protein LOC117317272 isoform X2 [Pecten maximus]|uniref:uncharacterized protein LOC117317272 isoform X2 n=1 Tax=Pecten maximus TaxID=6579 RepID=UPI00145858FC|nr:uncharacterized protein LOC117317272 isoform X2 [Pecten maximus]